MNSVPKGIAIGIGLQAASLITGYLFQRYLLYAGWIFALLISVPLFFASWFAIWRGPSPLWMRLAVSLWPLCFPLFYLGQYAVDMARMRKDIVLIPAGFQGKAVIHMGVPGGDPEVWENGRLVLRIGPDGIGKSRAFMPRFASDSVNSARRDAREYFELDAAGRRTPLPIPRPFDAPQLPPDKPVIFSMGEGYDANQILTVDFWVGTPPFIEKLLRGE